MKACDVILSFRGTVTVACPLGEMETPADIVANLTDRQIVDRLNFEDIVEQLDEDDIEVDDIGTTIYDTKR